MSDWLMRVIKAEAKHLIALAADDDELRADLRALANEILAATEDSEVEAKSPHPESGSSKAVAPAESEPNAEAIVEPLRELTLGRSVPPKSEPQAEPALASKAVTSNDELVRIEASCRWKGEAARSVAERMLRIREGNDCFLQDLPMDSEMAKWADRLADCFVWVQASELVTGGGSFAARRRGGLF